MSKLNVRGSAIYASVGNKIRQARVEAKMTEQELADHIGLTQDAVSLYELGKRAVALDLLCTFADKLDKPLSYFFDCGEDIVISKGSKLYKTVTNVQSSAEDTAALYDYSQFLQSRRA